MKTTFHDASGRQVDESVALDSNGVLRNGFSFKVPHTLMDSASAWDSTRVVHPLTDAETRDPFVPLTDEQKIAGIDARNERLSNAWRNPTPLADTKTRVHIQQPTPPTQDMDAIYDHYDKRTEDAWRRPAVK